jgi:D-alanyl-lipoteichoic acid acyltransferase DltB (MBOAT superfamily)
MLYNSFQFLFAFLPLCLLLYFLTAKASRGLANAVLAVMSLFFYAWWDWHNLMILLASILFNFAIGWQLRRRPEKWLLVIGIVANLVLLASFKYANFALSNWTGLTGRAFAPMQIVLPLGISFFTFTQIAFLVDAWQGLAGELNFSRYCLFVTFFPHLIAGPIVHHRELMPQFADSGSKHWCPPNLHLGMAFFALGLFKKVAIADGVAPWANSVFGATSVVSCAQAWNGALAYTLQLYFDFSGYSDMAIGLGLMFNVRLPDNFDAPYQAASIADFWHRWHMTLSRFLRDYLYIPLGGSRRGEPRRIVNLMLTMLLGGLWHGAGWTFVAWGGYHGGLLVTGHLWGDRRPQLPPMLARLLTFLAVVIGWVIFRADSLAKAGSILVSMTGFAGGEPHTRLALDPAGSWAVLALLLAFVNVAPTTKQWVETRTLGSAKAILLGILLFLSLLCMRTSLLTNRPSEFLYFQF